MKKAATISLAALLGCGGNVLPNESLDAGEEASLMDYAQDTSLGFSDGPVPDSAYPVCTDEGGPPARLDGGNCGTEGCGANAVCLFEVGGVAGGGGSWCSPVPARCETTRTCACMGACACPKELCLDNPDGGIGGCDDLVR
jgi:hypothetical protein